jgi:hypothetical protein
LIFREELVTPLRCLYFSSNSYQFSKASASDTRTPFQPYGSSTVDY